MELFAGADAATGSAGFEVLLAVGMTPKMAPMPAAESRITDMAATQRTGCILLPVVWASMLFLLLGLQRK